jgi:hypothetical protein
MHIDYMRLLRVLPRDSRISGNRASRDQTWLSDVVQQPLEFSSWPTTTPLRSNIGWHGR